MEEALSLVCSSSHVNQGQCVLWQNWSVWWRVANLECPSPRLPPAWNGKNCTASLSKKEVRGSSAFKPVISLGLFSCWTIRHEGWMQSLLYSYGPFFICPHFQNCVSSLEGRGGSNRMQPQSHRREHASYLLSYLGVPSYLPQCWKGSKDCVLSQFIHWLEEDAQACTKGPVLIHR